MLTVYRAISLRGKDFRTYLENYDLKNLRAQIDIHENGQKGKIFAPLSGNFIVIRCKLELHFHGHWTHLIYDFDNKTCLRIDAPINSDDEIQIAPKEVEDFTAELSSTELFINTLPPDETEEECTATGKLDHSLKQDCATIQST